MAHTQPSMEILFNSRDHDEVCGPIVCTPEGEIFFILWKAEMPDWTFNNGISYLYKISINGDTLYNTYYVKATYDGGVILTGSKYNYQE